MIENNPSDVASAFQILWEELEAEIEFVNGIRAKAFQAREALEFVGQITAFRDKVAALRKEWSSLEAAAASREDEETRAQRRNLGRPRKGLRTPESAYYVPILQALAGLGRSGQHWRGADPGRTAHEIGAEGCGLRANGQRSEHAALAEFCPVGALHHGAGRIAQGRFTPRRMGDH